MKIVNNDAYKFYNQLIDSYFPASIEKGMDYSGNNLFVHSATHLAAAQAENPFDVNTEEYQIYFQMMRHYSQWKLGGPDRKVSRRRFLAEAVKLAALRLENPFDYEIEPVIEVSDDVVSLEAQAEKEYAQEDAAAIESGTYVEVQEPVVVFGVVPETDDVEDGTAYFVEADDEPECVYEQQKAEESQPVEEVPEKVSLFTKLKNLFRKGRK